MLNAKNVPSNGQKFDRPDPLEPGTYPARLVSVVNMGLRAQPKYQGNEKPPAMDLQLTYELLDEFLKDEDGNEIEDKPRHLSETMPFHSLDADLAKSTKRYFALDPESEHGGDWTKLVGTPCMVNITQSKDKKDPEIIYNNISGVSSMRQKEADKAPELINEARVFDFYNPDFEIYLTLSRYTQDKIKEGLDFDGSELQKLIEAHGEAQEDDKGADTKKASKATESASEEVSDDEEEDW